MNWEPNLPTWHYSKFVLFTFIFKIFFREENQVENLRMFKKIIIIIAHL